MGKSQPQNLRNKKFRRVVVDYPWQKKSKTTEIIESSIFLMGFRWRGENVSTIEVEAVLSNVLNQQDTIVYGVEVPGVEGRAGMAAIVEPSEGLDLKSFLSAIKNQLPSYATPIFLRFVQNLDITGEHNIAGFFFS